MKSAHQVKVTEGGQRGRTLGNVTVRRFDGGVRKTWCPVNGEILYTIKILVELDHCHHSCARLTVPKRVEVQLTMGGLLSTWSIGKKSEKKQVFHYSYVLSGFTDPLYFCNTTVPYIPEETKI